MDPVTDVMRQAGKQQFVSLLQKIGQFREIDRIVAKLEGQIFATCGHDGKMYLAACERKLMQTEQKLQQAQKSTHQQKQAQSMQSTMQPHMHMGMQQGMYPGYQQQVPQQQQQQPPMPPPPAPPGMGDMNMGGAPANDGMFSEFLNVFMEGEGEVGGGGMPQQQQQQQQQMGGYGMSQPQGGRPGTQQYGVSQAQPYQQQSYPQQPGMGMVPQAAVGQQPQYGGASGQQQWGQQLPMQHAQGMNGGQRMVPNNSSGYPMQQQQQPGMPGSAPGRAAGMPQQPMQAPQLQPPQLGMQQPGLAPGGGMPGQGEGGGGQQITAQQISELFWKTQAEIRARYLDPLKLYYSRMAQAQQQAAQKMQQDPNAERYRERLLQCKKIFDLIAHPQGDSQAPQPTLENVRFLHKMRNTLLKQIEQMMPKLTGQSSAQQAQQAQHANSAANNRTQQQVPVPPQRAGPDASGAVASTPVYPAHTPPLQMATPTPGPTLPAATPPTTDQGAGGPVPGMAVAPPAARPPLPPHASGSLPAATPMSGTASTLPGVPKPAAVTPQAGPASAGDVTGSARSAPAPGAPPPQSDALAAVMKLLTQDTGDTVGGTAHAAPCAMHGMLDLDLATPPIPAHLHVQASAAVAGSSGPAVAEPSAMRAVGLCHADDMGGGATASDVSATDTYRGWLAGGGSSDDEDAQEVTAVTAVTAATGAVPQGAGAGHARGGARKRRREEHEELLQLACAQVEATLGPGLQLRVVPGPGASPLGSQYLAVEVTADVTAGDCRPSTSASPVALAAAKRLKVCVPCSALQRVRVGSGGGAAAAAAGAGPGLEEVAACPVFPSTDAGYDEHVPGAVRALLQALLERAPAHGLLHVVAAWRNALHSTLNPDAHAPVFLDPLPRAATGSRGVVVM